MEHTRHLTCKTNPRATLKCCFCYHHSDCELGGENRIAVARRLYDRREFWTWIGIGLFVAIPVVTLGLIYYLIR